MNSGVPLDTRLKDVLLLEGELQHLADCRKREKQLRNVVLASFLLLVGLSLIHIFRFPTRWYSYVPFICCFLASTIWTLNMETMNRAGRRYHRFTNALANFHLVFDPQAKKLFHATNPPPQQLQHTSQRGRVPPTQQTPQPRETPIFIPPSPTDLLR